MRFDTSGPSSVASSSGSPTRRLRARSTSRSRTVPYRLRGTTTRESSAQVWPVLSNEAFRRLVNISSRSADSSTIAADLPPSSSVTGMRRAPAADAICLPASAEPVKLTLSMPGCATSARPVSRPPETMLMTPGGIPIAMLASAKWYASSGVSSAGLMTTVQPAASAGASLSVVEACGWFHGTMRAATPSGSLRMMELPSRRILGRTSSSS
jgi:hypothetical protein